MAAPEQDLMTQVAVNVGGCGGGRIGQAGKQH
jgi:hypothetical protein